MNRRCLSITENGSPCRQAPGQGSDYCFWHDPDHQTEAAEARRLGGMRRRRESTIVGAFEVGDLASVEELRRLLQIAVIDTLGLENSIARSRTLGYLTQVGSVLLEKGEMETRLRELEETLVPRRLLAEPPKQRRY